MCGCLSHALQWGPGPQPRPVPWLAIEPATLWFAGQHSIHRATPARAIEYTCFLGSESKHFLNLISKNITIVFNIPKVHGLCAFWTDFQSILEPEHWETAEGGEIILEKLFRNGESRSPKKTTHKLVPGLSEHKCKRLLPQTRNVQLRTQATVVILYAPSWKVQTVFS